jgi:hypothetical protein
MVNDNQADSWRFGQKRICVSAFLVPKLIPAFIKMMRAEKIVQQHGKGVAIDL